MPDLEALLNKASTFKPKDKPRGKWAQYFPVYSQLRKNGASVKQALDWLTAEDCIPEDQQEDARKSFMQMVVRRNRKEKTTP